MSSVKWSFCLDINVLNYLCDTSVEEFYKEQKQIDGLVPDCGISSANTLKILQYFTKPSIFTFPQNNSVHEWFNGWSSSGASQSSSLMSVGMAFAAYTQ